MSFLTENWPILLFAGVMIYMHLFMHRGHGKHRHHEHRSDPARDGERREGEPTQQPEHRGHRQGGC